MRGIMRGDNSLLPDYVTKQIIFIFLGVEPKFIHRDSRRSPNLVCQVFIIKERGNLMVAPFDVIRLRLSTTTNYYSLTFSD